MSNFFAERLKKLRGDRSKAEFARFLGVSAPVYQRYEEGRIPRADTLSVIAERLGVTVRWLLNGDGLVMSAVYESGVREPQLIGDDVESMRREISALKAELKQALDVISNLSVALAVRENGLSPPLGAAPPASGVRYTNPKPDKRSAS